MHSDHRSAIKRVCFYLVACVGVPLLILALIEGGSSLMLFVRGWRHSTAALSKKDRWMTFDPAAGSVLRPNVFAKDLFGPGLDLRTNAQGFRNRQDFTPSIPAGRRRFICSGDSYTLGHRVGDPEPWCALLGSFDSTLETPNLGVGGYGFDQAYFRYRTQGEALEYDLHLFAFITADLYRMRQSWEWAWQKRPVQSNGGELRVTERVSCLICARPSLRALAVSLSDLRSVALLDLLGRRLHLGRPLNREREIGELADAIIVDLASRATARNSRLVLVHLPTIADYTHDHSLPWRDRIREIAARNGVTYIDLIEDFRRVPRDSVSSMFIPLQIDPGEHYAAPGHAWVAQQLHRRLRDAGLWSGVASPPKHLKTGGP